jgi:hypothetical protein
MMNQICEKISNLCLLEHLKYEKNSANTFEEFAIKNAHLRNKTQKELRNNILFCLKKSTSYTLKKIDV